MSAISLHFKDGPRAPLAMPLDCGTKSVDASLSSWAGHLVERADSFTMPCTPDLGLFSPSFQAGMGNTTAGAFSPFALRINRADRQQYMNGLSLDMPPGLIGKLRGIPQCPEDRANAGTCGIESRIGTTTVGAGPGSNPFYIDGSVSLTGPYKGAPFGLSAAVRVVAGPFDLGMVVVRQAIFVDPVDAHITVVSDPLPTIVKGVPVRLRSLERGREPARLHDEPHVVLAEADQGHDVLADGRSAPGDAALPGGRLPGAAGAARASRCG